MKVLMINTVPFGKNGITAHILNSYKELRKQGNVDIDFVSINEWNDNVYFGIARKEMNVYVMPERNCNAFKYILCLTKLIRNNKYDVVHVHGNSCIMAVELSAAALGGCKVRIAHSHNTMCNHKRLHMLLRPVFELLCNGRFACGRDAGRWLFRKKAFTVIPNGLLPEQYAFSELVRNELRRKLQIDNEEILLGNVGGFCYQKNQEFLIEVMKKLISKGKRKYKLVLLGDGEDRPEFLKKLAQEKLQDFILCPGNVEHVENYLQAMDCFLLPSRYEGLPYVLLEAQASGLHCIVSDQVSTEAGITVLVEYLPLDRDLWTGLIEQLDVSIGLRDDDSYGELLQREGYDIRDSGRRILEKYEGFVYGSNQYGT